MGSCLSSRVLSKSSSGLDDLHLSSCKSSSSTAAHKTEGEILSSTSVKSFTFNELKLATRNFRSDSVVGEGGFGTVFRGWIDETTLTPTKSSSGLVIAVKRLNHDGFQGHREWLTEINYLGQLSHPNLVKLIGYCLEDEQRLLVYEFMHNGSLENHLFTNGVKCKPLSWILRVKVALDAAKGLAFLHSDPVKVIYRDIKASNILLDSDYNAKLSDFGLARDGPMGETSYVSTRVMGTFGYAAPGKPLIKLTKNRIDVLRRKRTATIKFLKKDLADLMFNGLDVNAYTRAGGLLDELRHLWNLDFVEQTCDFVYKQLSTMQKMGECPEDCREAVSSLMFAASGFSELPELRELRQMFHERYSDSLGLFVNQELVENMSSKPFSLEKKVKLMEDVAVEFSIRWDSKDFEKRIVRQNSTSVKETPKSIYDKYKPVDGNMALPKRKEVDLSSNGRFEGFDNGLSLNRKKADASERRDPLFQPDKEIYQNGLRGNQHELTTKQRSENGRHMSRSESKDNKAERKEFYLKSKQELSRERHQPIFNEGDTIVMKVKHENFGQGNGHQPDAHKKTEVIASERKEFYLQSKREPSRERHQPIFNEGDTIVMKVKRENHVEGNGHQIGVVDAHKKTEAIASEKLKSSSTKRADKLVIGFKQESFFQGYKHEKHEEHAHQKVEDNTSRPPKPSSKSKRAESTDPGLRQRNDQESKENAVLVGKITENPSGGNIKGGEYDYDHANPARKVEERETERMKTPFYRSLPPPYVKPSAKARNEKAEASDNPKARFDGEEGNHPDIDKNVCGVERGNERGHHHQGNDIDNPSLKRRTSRRKHIVQSGGDDHTISRRRENSRKGLQVLIDEDEKDSEEKMMDKLLMHYSKKPSSYERKDAQQESKSRRTHDKKGEYDEEMMIHQPARSRSLPSEHGAGPSEPRKTFARAASFQPERSSEAKHVHPKLPNYDDLAARFAELKGS